MASARCGSNDEGRCDDDPGQVPRARWSWELEMIGLSAATVAANIALAEACYQAMPPAVWDGRVEGRQSSRSDRVIVMSNAGATKGKAAVNTMRDRGVKVGLLRLRLIRPFPCLAIRAALRGRRSVMVVDQNLAPGLGGILFQEIAAALYDDPERPQVLRSFVGGLECVRLIHKVGGWRRVRQRRWMSHVARHLPPDAVPWVLAVYDDGKRRGRGTRNP